MKYIVITILMALAITSFALRAEGSSVVSPALLNAIALTESGGNANALGSHGERGLFQIMPSTWHDHAKGVSFDRAFDPVENLQVASRYLSWIERTLERKLGHRPSLEQILSAYNGGVGRLQKANYDVEHMPASTRQYVAKVINNVQ